MVYIRKMTTRTRSHAEREVFTFTVRDRRFSFVFLFVRNTSSKTVRVDDAPPRLFIPIDRGIWMYCSGYFFTLVYIYYICTESKLNSLSPFVSSRIFWDSQHKKFAIHLKLWGRFKHNDLLCSHFSTDESNCISLFKREKIIWKKWQFGCRL